jgi:hypothetical protein
VNNTPASFDDLQAQARELGFDEVTLILSQSRKPNGFVMRSNVQRDDRVAQIVEAVEHSIIGRMISNLGADAPFARYLDRRRAKGGCRPR